MGCNGMAAAFGPRVVCAQGVLCTGCVCTRATATHVAGSTLFSLDTGRGCALGLAEAGVC